MKTYQEAARELQDATSDLRDVLVAKLRMREFMAWLLRKVGSR